MFQNGLTFSIDQNQTNGRFNCFENEPLGLINVSPWPENELIFGSLYRNHCMLIFTSNQTIKLKIQPQEKYQWPLGKMNTCLYQRTALIKSSHPTPVLKFDLTNTSKNSIHWLNTDSPNIESDKMYFLRLYMYRGSGNLENETFGEFFEVSGY